MPARGRGPFPGRLDFSRTPASLLGMSEARHGEIEFEGFLLQVDRYLDDRSDEQQRLVLPPSWVVDMQSRTTRTRMYG